MRRLLLTLTLLACAPDKAPDARAASETRCEHAARIRALPRELGEASGIAISRRHPGTLWVHNDSGEPELFALDTLGRVRARIRLDVPNQDWEDIAVGACGERSCLYVGAIGDNRQNRTDRQIHRLPEPALGARGLQVVESFRYRLPGDPQDTEALFVLPDETIYLITKGRSGPIALYRFPQPASTSAVNELQLVQKLTPGLVQLPDMVTGAAATPDGRIIAVRTYSALQLYSFERNQLVPLLRDGGLDLQPLRERQGEGIDIRADGTVFLVSEKGLEETDPPLSRVQCKWSTR